MQFSADKSERLCNTLLHDIQSRSNEANFYGPIKISRPPKDQFKIVQAIVMNVP